MLFCCEAPEMFCGLRLTQLTLYHQEGERRTVPLLLSLLSLFILPADMLVSSVSPVSSFITFRCLSHEFVVCNWTCLPVDLLGDRLEAAEDAQLQAQACLCYICAGNVEKLVSCWTRAQDGRCPLSLQVGLLQRLMDWMLLKWLQRKKEVKNLWFLSSMSKNWISEHLRTSSCSFFTIFQRFIDQITNQGYNQQWNDNKYLLAADVYTVTAALYLKPATNW